MVRHTSGLICVPLEGERLDELALPLMVQQNTESFHTAFTISVDLVHGTTTGISAADRATTINALADRRYGPIDFATARPRLPAALHDRAACCCDRVTRKPPSISAALPKLSPPGCCANW